jgi:type II secretory pathway pseudopilin PulG
MSDNKYRIIFGAHMLKEIVYNRKEENAFSLLELSVAVGVAAIVAVAGVVATTAFIGSAETKRDNYTSNANSAIDNAREASAALADGFYDEGGGGEGGGGAPNPFLNFAYNGATNGGLTFTRGESAQSFMPNSIYSGATYSIVSGSLPNGVTLNPTTGAITGPSDWGFNTTQAGGTGNDAGRSVVSTSDGGTIITGVFTGIASFGTTTLTSAGGEDIFVAKVDASGDYVWAVRVGASGNDYSYSATATDDGGAVITGWFYNTVSFGALSSLTSQGNADIFIAKINSGGTWQWSSRAGGTGNDEGFSVSMTSDGDKLLLSGRLTGTASFGSTSLTSSGGEDIFAARLNTSNGSWDWATKAGGSGNETGLSIAAADDGSAAVTGFFHNTAWFGSTSIQSTNNINGDIFIAKVNSDGTWGWAKRAGGSRFDVGRSVVFNDSGEIFVTGAFEETASFGSDSLTASGAYDIFVAKLNADGTWAWAKKAGGTSTEYGLSITTVSDGAVLTGIFEGATTIGSNSLTHSGGTDIFVAKIGNDGTWGWAKRIGSTGADEGNSVSKAVDGGVIVSGSFSGSITIGSNSLTSNGGTNIFTAKINSNGEWATSAIQFVNENVTVRVEDGQNSYEYPISIIAG